MEIRVSIEVVDDGTTLYNKTKQSIFGLEKHFDRMVASQIAELFKDHRQDYKKDLWFNDLKDERESSWG